MNVEDFIFTRSNKIQQSFTETVACSTPLSHTVKKSFGNTRSYNKKINVFGCLAEVLLARIRLWIYMDKLYSVGKRFIKRLIIDDITIIQVGSYKGFIDSKQALLW